MKQYFWDEKKNQKLIQERGVSFEDIVQAIAEGYTLDDTAHPRADQYPNQFVYVIRLADYVYLVPYEAMGEKIRLITIIPSRKARRKYLPRNKENWHEI
jgi:uncharacterized DUF497 family protein